MSSVSEEVPLAVSVANGVTTVFPHLFTVLETGDFVSYGVLAGVKTAYVYGVDYTLTGIGLGSGSAVFFVAPVAGTVVTRYRVSGLGRTIDYQNNGDLLAATVNEDFNRLWLALQDIVYGGIELASVLRAPAGESLSTLPPAAVRASTLQGYDSTGDVTTYPAGSGAVGAASSISFLQAGAGMIGRTVEDKLRDASRTPKDAGATGLAADNATSMVQAAMDAAIADATSGNSLEIPDGDYRVSTITVDVDDVVSSDTGRVSIYGHGNSSALTMRESPNTDIFQFLGTGSFGANIHDLRFQVATQGNNVDASVVNTTADATMLDFSVYNNYLNGVPRGFSGQYVSGMFVNNMFDFMSDYGLHGISKEFRKLEIVANHFFAVKQRAIWIEGELRSDGTPTQQVADRDNGRGAGHLAIVGNGFDRLFDNSETQQHIYITEADNFVIAGNWHNGKTPDSTDYPLDAIRIVGSNNFVIGPEVAWMFDRGVYFEDCHGFSIKALLVAMGNKNASAALGAISFVDCSGFDADVTVLQSGGLGVVVDGCTDYTLSGLIKEAQLSGLLINDSPRGKVNVKVVDANMADSGTTANTIGIDVQGASDGVDLSGSHSYVTNSSAGQKKNVRFAGSTSGCSMFNGRLTSVRTAGVAVEDNGTGNKVQGTPGWVTKATGQATITNPATSVVVTHGLSVTPSIADIHLEFNDAAAGVTRMWPSTITSTQFTINVNASPTTSALFGWFVDTEH